MSLQINRSFAANSANALQAYHTNQTSMGKAITNVSTGKRVNSAADDVTSYLASKKFQNDTSGYSALYKGVQNGATYLNAVNTGFDSIAEALRRMSELARDYDTKGDTNTNTALQNEFNYLKNVIEDTAKMTIGGKAQLLEETGQTMTFETALSNTGTTGATYELYSFDNGTTTEITYSFAEAISDTKLKEGSAFYGSSGTIIISSGTTTYGTYKLTATNVSSDVAASDCFTGAASDSSVTWYYVTNAGAADNASNVGVWSLSSDSKSINIRWFNSGTTTGEAGGVPFGSMSNTLSVGTSNIKLTTSTTIVTEATNISGNAKLTDAKFNSSGILTEGKLNNYMLATDNKVYDATTFEQKGTWKAAKGAVSLELNSAASGNGTGSFTVTWDGVLSNISNLDIEDKSGIDSALTVVSAQQANVGAGITALSYASDHLANMTSAMDNAYTAITEADMAEEMTKYVRSNIYAQAAQAMIAQANQSMAQVLNLLQ